ncbi:hypothetical protein [Serratia fonticola]|uniref:beta-sandwich lipoprotein n=1 Tax=Serratia fonticola TaxID=47917 RepID=UPI00093A8CEB|nr:hypothetical protein [Serratia fonticola]OKP29421.1 hypothetical protein BSQ40_09380 [Serratia fonticola]
MKKAIIALAVLMLAGCDVNDADVVSKNLSTASDNFEVNRRVVFYNGITGDYMLSIEGLCSKDNSSTSNTLGIVCKVGPSQYKKHMLGLSDNVTFFIEQIDGVKASPYFYRVTFKPSVIVPDIDVR